MDEVLAKAGLFQGVSAADAEVIAGQFDILDVPRGAVVFHEAADVPENEGGLCVRHGRKSRGKRAHFPILPPDGGDRHLFQRVLPSWRTLSRSGRLAFWPSPSRNRTQGISAPPERFVMMVTLCPVASFTLASPSASPALHPT